MPKTSLFIYFHTKNHEKKLTKVKNILMGNSYYNTIKAELPNFINIKTNNKIFHPLQRRMFLLGVPPSFDSVTEFFVEYLPFSIVLQSSLWSTSLFR